MCVGVCVGVCWCGSRGGGHQIINGKGVRDWLLFVGRQVGIDSGGVLMIFNYINLEWVV